MTRHPRRGRRSWIARRRLLGQLKRVVPVAVKWPVQRALPDRYKRYFDPDWHRKTIRRNVGHWDYLGKLQLEYLVERGLKPEHHLLDVGCGPFGRGGGALHRLPRARPLLRRRQARRRARDRADGRAPRYRIEDKEPQLLATDHFEFGKLGRKFDYAIAQSVFTHLPLNSIIRCLVRWAC